MMKEKIKIGLLIEDYDVAKWVYILVERIIKSNNLEIILVIKNGSKMTIDQKYLDQIRGLLLRKYLKFDLKRYPLIQSAFEIKSLRNILHCPEIDFKTSDEENEINKLKNFEIIRSVKMDVLLKLNSAPLERDLIQYSKYGLWSYNVGNYYTNDTQYDGVNEFINKQDETRVTLLAWKNNNAKAQILYESYSSTDKFSIHRNLNNIYWKALSFMPRKLEDLYNLGPEKIFNHGNMVNSNLVSFDNIQHTNPKNWELITRIFNDLWVKLKNKVFYKFYFDQWILLFSINKGHNSTSKFHDFIRIIPPKDRFWADPFIIYKNQTHYIFFEELIYKKGKGTIKVMEMNEKGKYKEPQNALERNYHLSYPFLIEEKGYTYMIPETKNNKTIELYECEEFPYKWRLRETLFNNIEAVDTTVIKYKSKYWLFTNIKENSGTFTVDDELFLFYSDSLLNGRWTPHPKNPIVSDVRSARPAGKIFIQNNRLFRPAQNCAKHYGHGITLNEILVLTEDEYSETQVQSINPNWCNDLLSTHTLNHSEKLTIIDAKIKRRRF